MSYERKPLASVNVTPLVDVLLILLVVMMLAMPMFVKRLPVELPNTALTGAPTPAQTLYVAIQADGTLVVDGAVLPIESVLALATSETSVEMAADRDTRYEFIAKIVAALQAHGITNVSLLSN